MDIESTTQNSANPPDTQLTEVVIKARCPSCFKLYAIDVAEIHSSKPHFACSKCQSQFWFPYPESLEQKEVLGFPVEWLQPGETAKSPILESPLETSNSAEARVFHCPRCQGHYSAGDTECPKCGVVFSKLDFIEGSQVPSSPGLRRQWHQVMDHYGQVEMHRRFIQMAQREGKLDFASQQYRRLLAAHSGDETALQMQKEIMALALTAPVAATSQVRPFRLMKLMPRLTTLALMAGGALIGFGLMIEAARNLIGLGAALVFFTLAAGWLFDRD